MKQRRKWELILGEYGIDSIFLKIAIRASSVKWFRGIGEYIIDWGPGYRIYLAQDGDTLVILFGGSTKRSQQKAIDQAVALHEEYKARKKALAPQKKDRKP